MGKAFYSKLAITNIKNNKNIYFPYIITCICSVVMFYIMHSISVNSGLKEMRGAVYLKNILDLGTVVIGIFSTIFLFYTNSFLIKQRKKELGLLNILGMGKKHVGKVLFFEVIFIGVISIVVGLLFGVIFSKLMFLVLAKLVAVETPIKYSIPTKSFSVSSILFSVIFLVTLFFNLFKLHLSRPIELLKGSQVGEKEPKTKWFMTIAGIIALSAGYAIAIIVESPLRAINLFFIAVLLVMLGTYYLFIAGSITLLKLLKRVKGFYYKIENFISVSNMIYRMKQNAVGLANICILSTAVIIMLSTTLALTVGIEDVLNTMFPRDVIISLAKPLDENVKFINNNVNEAINKHNIEIENKLEYNSTSLVATCENNEFTVVEKSGFNAMDNCFLEIITVDEYNSIENTKQELLPNEILVFSDHGYEYNNLFINGKEYVVREEENNVCEILSGGIKIIKGYTLIVKDDSVVKEMFNEKAQNNSMNYPSYYLSFNIKGDEDQAISFMNEITSSIQEGVTSSVRISWVKTEKDMVYAMNGGLLFIGIFLGTLFLIATVLIIYYKQMTEAYNDKSRFELMQKIGLKRNEVKKIIDKQVLIIFLLPLVTSIIHVAVAFKMITRILSVLYMYNVPLILLCTVITIGIFTAIYILAYRNIGTVLLFRLNHDET